MAEKKASLKIRKDVHKILSMASAKSGRGFQEIVEIGILRFAGRYVPADEIRRAKEAA